MGKTNQNLQKIVIVDVKKSFGGVQNLKPGSTSKPSGGSSSGSSTSSGSGKGKK